MLETTQLPAEQQQQLLNNHPDVMCVCTSRFVFLPSGGGLLTQSCPPPCFSPRHGSPTERILGAGDVEAGSRKGRSEARASKREVKMQEEGEKKKEVECFPKCFFKVSERYFSPHQKVGAQ